MKISLWTIISTFCLLSFHVYAQKMGPDQIAHDLDELIRGLEIYHNNPYHYQTKETIFQKINEITSRTDSMDVVDFWREVDRVLCLVNDAHTRTYPTAYLKEYKKESGGFLPMAVTERDGDIFVAIPKGPENPVQKGDQLLSINGVPINQLLDELKANCGMEVDFLDQQSVVQSFSHYIWESKGWPGPYKVEYISNENGQKNTAIVNGLPHNKVFAVGKKSTKPPYTLSYQNENTAVLWFKDFSSTGRKAFDVFCKQSFKEIKEKNIQHLIIDVRNHNGGDARFAEELGKYFADKPFRTQAQTIWNVNPTFKKTFARLYIPGVMRWCKPLYGLNKHTKAIWKVKDRGQAVVDFKEIKPYNTRKQFRGDVYVLVDGGTFSAGSIFAGMVKDYNLATLVGQPTGNLSSFYADPIIWVRLKHSKIRFQISASYNVRPNGEADDHTILPDIELSKSEDPIQKVMTMLQ